MVEPIGGNNKATELMMSYLQAKTSQGIKIGEDSENPIKSFVFVMPSGERKTASEEQPQRNKTRRLFFMPEKRVDYSRKWIALCLEHYSWLEEGKWFEKENGEFRRIPTFRAPFENAVIAKADIDTAIDALSRIEREVITKRYLEGYEVWDIERTIPNAERVTKRAIWNMYYFLNGECVLRRWARENNLVDGKGRPLFPECLTPDIDQFIKDICLDFCVVDKCPK